MRHPQYVLTPDGLRLHDAGGKSGPVLREGLALLFDREEGEVLKHGSPAVVEDSLRRLTASLAGTTLAPDLQVLTLAPGQLTPELLVEVNRALRTPGHVTHLARRLSPGTPPGGETPGS